MLTIYAILLYFQAIFTTTTYTDVNMDQIIQANNPRINTTQQDAILMNQIHQTYDGDAGRIVVVDTDEIG
jgi:hypothetical protein